MRRFRVWLGVQLTLLGFWVAGVYRDKEWESAVFRFRDRKVD